jgi:hypothetical protein
MATGVAASGLKGKLTGLMRGWGPTLGIALAATLGPEFARSAGRGLSGQSVDFDLPKKMVEPLGALIGPIGDVERALQGLVGGNINKLQDFGETAEQAFKKAREGGDSLRLAQLGDQARELAREFPKSSRELRRFAEAADEAAREAAGSFRDLSRLGGKDLKTIKTATTNTAFTIKNRLGHDSEAAKKALAKNFAGAARAVEKSMKAGTISTKTGTRLIEQYMVEALKNMGFTKEQAVTLRQGRDPFTGKAIGGGQNLTGKQRGGPINVGAPTGDSVPALLERGEYVLNRQAVKKVGRGALDQLNFAGAPRFQGGGIVELLHPFNDPAGHGGSNSHLHIAMTNVERLIALGRKLQRLGWLVGEHPAFGGIQGRHAPGGYHYRPGGQAIDVNWPDPGAEGGKIRQILGMLGQLAAGGGGGGAAPKLRRLLVDGPTGPLKGLVQAALDTARGGAQARLDSAAGSMSLEGVESVGSGPWTQVMASIAQGRGWNLADWQRLVQKESGGNPNARNPSSGAYGLGQFLGATARSYAKYGALSPDGSDQIRAMAQYISDRYGNPSNALAFHNRNNWYQLGGPVGMLAGGDPFSSNGRRPGLAGAFGRTLRRFRGAKGKKAPKIRAEAVKGLLEKIRAVGLPDRIESNLRKYAKDSGVFGEMADRAGQLTVEDADGNPIPSAVGGKTQAQWLTDQLTALLKWRNTLIRAHEIAVERRELTTSLIERAKGRLDAIDKRLGKLRKNPKRNRAIIRALTREKGTLKDRILPALTTKRSGLNDLRGNLLSSLEEVQGIGSPMTRFRALPGVGVLGGTILSAQLSLRDLNAPRTTVTDTTSDAADESAAQRAEILEQLLRESTQRTAVSEAHFKELIRSRDLPPYGGSFADGGIVPGPVGAPKTIIAHGGEYVDPGGGARPGMRVVIEDHRVRVFDERGIEQVVERVNRRTARSAARGLSGGGGLRG